MTMKLKQLQTNLIKYMRGEEFEKIQSGFITWLTHGFHIIILIAGMTIAFVAGKYYDDVSKIINNTNENFTQIHHMDQVSISINDRNELIILDRYTSKVQLYTDTIGLLIQKMYLEKHENAIKSVK